MTGGVVLVIVVVLFLLVIVGFNNEAKKASETMEKKRINESNAAKIQQLKNEIKPISTPKTREKTKEEIYRELQNSVEITESYFRTLTASIGAPDDFFEYIGNIGSSPSLVRVPKSKLEEWESKYQPTKEFNENLSKVCTLNNKGIELEKDGNIDEAIAIYEECILIPYKAHHSYDRLLVLYRKRKDYENEKKVCLLAVERFPEDAKYKDRLVAIESKITKALKP